MALVVPIITQFNGKGIAKARKEFSQLEGAGAKMGFLLKKSMLPAAAGIAAVGTAAFQAGQELMGMVDAAAEDQAGQKKLALSIRAVTKATDSQISAVEDYIDATQMAVGVADDKLRPAYARLVRSTRDMQKAQTLLNLALDVSAATGKPLEAVANALGKAYDGQNTAIGRLGLGIDKATLKGMTFEELQTRLTNQFGGSALQAAGTYEGKMALLRIRIGELKESIGAKLMPIFERLVELLSRVADAFGEKGITGAIQQLKFEFAMADKDNPILRTMERIYNAGVAVKNLYASMQRGFARILNLAVPFGGYKFGEMQNAQDFWQMIGNPAPPLVNLTPGGTGIGPGSPQGWVGPSSSSLGRPERVTTQSITINTGADPRSVVDALTRYNRQSGGVPVRIQQ